MNSVGAVAAVSPWYERGEMLTRWGIVACGDRGLQLVHSEDRSTISLAGKGIDVVLDLRQCLGIAEGKSVSVVLRIFLRVGLQQKMKSCDDGQAHELIGSENGCTLGKGKQQGRRVLGGMEAISREVCPSRSGLDRGVKGEGRLKGTKYSKK